MNLIALRCFGPTGLCSFVAIRRRQRGQITTGCFGRGPMTENETHSCRTCQSGEDGQKPPGRCEPSWKVSDPSWRKLLPHSQASYSRSLPAISRHCWATHPHLHPTSRVLFARSSHSRALASYRPERHREQMPREGRVFQLGRYLCKNPRFPRTRHPWLGRVVAAAYSS